MLFRGPARASSAANRELVAKLYRSGFSRAAFACGVELVVRTCLCEAEDLA